MSGDVVSLQFPEFAEGFKGDFRLVVGLPVVKVSNAFVKVVAGEEAGVPVGTASKRRLAHVILFPHFTGYK